MISVLGAGAFGTSLAIALSKNGEEVTLWARDPSVVNLMKSRRTSGPRLSGFSLPDSLTVTADIEAALGNVCLLAVPTQMLARFLQSLPSKDAALIACCKGIDQNTGLGPVRTIQAARPNGTAAVLTGPSFAVDIADGLPTALILAAEDDSFAATLQATLTRPALRIYRSTDVTGAELGGALKNVVALAAGMAVGAKLGDSARASVIARGFSELNRYATAKGARAETLSGLAGLGDLVLTCTSIKSRNFAAGVALGEGARPASDTTIEGLFTARALAHDADKTRLDLPLIRAVAAVVDGTLDIGDAIETLMSRPVGRE